MSGVIEESGCLARAVSFAAALHITGYTFSKPEFVNLAERRQLQRIQMECTLCMPQCTVEAFDALFHRFSEYLGPARASKLKGHWDSLSEPRKVVYDRALSKEYKPYVQRHLADNPEGAIQILKKHELEPCEHLESVKDSWVHNMFQEKIFGAQSEVYICR
jgi:hypothetical protein